MGTPVRRSVLVLPFLLALVSCGPAADGPAAAQMDNAAPEYRRIFASLPEGTKEAAEAGFEAKRFSKGMLALLEERQPYIAELMEATRRPSCGFEADFSKGMHKDMPHLVEVRILAKLLFSDARRMLDSGDETGAAERTAAILRLANHFRGPQCTAEKIVGLSILEFGLDIADRLCARPRLGTEPRRILLGALDAFDAADLLDCSQSIGVDRDFIARALRTGEYVETLGERVQKLTPAQRTAVAGDVERLFDQISGAWFEPDAAVKIAAIVVNHPGRAAAGTAFFAGNLRGLSDESAGLIADVKACLGE